MSPLKTNLYLDRIDLKRYCPDQGQLVSPASGDSSGKTCLDTCPLMNARQIRACRLAIDAEAYLPADPPVTDPRPIEPGLIALNEPDENALLLVSANNSITLEVLMAVWSQGVTPAHLLLIDCLGHTVDMAMVFGEFKPDRLAEALAQADMADKVSHHRMVVPGLTAPLAEEFGRATGWEIEIGPVCAAELPLFLGDRWVFPG